MVASQNKADVLCVIDVLSDNFFNNDGDKDVYAATIEEYFGESGDESDVNMDNDEGMHIHCAIP